MLKWDFDLASFNHPWSIEWVSWSAQFAESAWLAPLMQVWGVFERVERSVSYFCRAVGRQGSLSTPPPYLEHQHLYPKLSVWRFWLILKLQFEHLDHSHSDVCRLLLPLYNTNYFFFFFGLFLNLNRRLQVSLNNWFHNNNSYYMEIIAHTYT